MLVLPGDFKTCYQIILFVSGVKDGPHLLPLFWVIGDPQLAQHQPQVLADATSYSEVHAATGRLHSQHHIVVVSR